MPYTCTPTLAYGSTNEWWPDEAATIDNAIESIEALNKVVVPSKQMAVETLVRLGVATERAEWLATPADGDVTVEKHATHDQKTHGNRSARSISNHKPQLAERAFAGGGTYDWRSGEFVETGTMVALAAHEGPYKAPSGGWSQAAMSEAITDWAARPDVRKGLSGKDAHVGSWLNPANDILYLDVTRVHKGSAVQWASSLAKAEGQIAFYVGEPGADNGLWVRDDAGEYQHTPD